MAPHFCPSSPCPICCLPMPATCPCGRQPWPIGAAPPAVDPDPIVVTPWNDPKWLAGPQCECPAAWWGIYPPPCPVHNPPGGQAIGKVIDVTWSGCASIPTEPGPVPVSIEYERTYATIVLG